LSDKCDIYALGVILWEMITGRKAFPSRSWYEIADEKQKRPLSVGSDGPADVPPGLRNLVGKCTNPDAESRPTAAEACARLAEI